MPSANVVQFRSNVERHLPERAKWRRERPRLPNNRLFVLFSKLFGEGFLDTDPGPIRPNSTVGHGGSSCKSEESISGFWSNRFVMAEDLRCTVFAIFEAAGIVIQGERQFILTASFPSWPPPTPTVLRRGAQFRDFGRLFYLNSTSCSGSR